MDALIFLGLDDINVLDISLDALVKERVDTLLRIINQCETEEIKDRADSLKRLVLKAKNLLLERRNEDDYRLDEIEEYQELFKDYLDDEIFHLINKHFTLEEIIYLELKRFDLVKNEERNINTYYVRRTILHYAKKEFNQALESFKDIKEESKSLSIFKLMISKNIRQ